MKDYKNNILSSAYVIDKDYRIIDFNSSIRDLYPNLQIGDLCYEKLTGESQPCQVCPLRTPRQEGLLYYNKLLKVWTDCVAAPLDLTDKQERYVVICHRINVLREDQKQQALKLLEEEGKERNPLTGLYNRETFLSKVEAMLKAVRPSEYCMIALDVENFKLYNSWYGFQRGSEFLHYIGSSMRRISQNIGLSGYMGDDDFAALLPNQESLLLDLSERLRQYIDSREESVGFYPAMGIYVIDDIKLSVVDIYDRASTARTFLRGNHMSRMIWYEDSMVQNLKEDYNLLNDLKRGLAQDEFIFFLQPKCDMRNKSIVGMEALCRWQNPDGGIVGPNVFIPKMEANGLITDLDKQIWEKVCIWIHDCIRTGKKTVPISINVSRIDFMELDVVGELKCLVEKYEIPKSLLEVEVTESAYAEHEFVVKHMVSQLRSNGFTVSMDDFGSGYSSLNMLQNATVDILKLDMRFLQLEDDKDERGLHILEMIIHLAKTLNIKVIAEGVESEKHRDLLLQMGCCYAQGYYYYKPMDAEAAGKLLDTSPIGTLELLENRADERAEESSIDAQILLAQLANMSEKYQAQKERIKIYNATLRACFDEEFYLDYSTGSYDAFVGNVLLLMKKNWNLPLSIRKVLQEFLKPEGLPHQKGTLPMRRQTILTEDDKELEMVLFFTGNKKALLCVRNHGELSAERIMMNHPYLWSYDYNVEQDLLKVVVKDDFDKIKTIELEGFRKNIRGITPLVEDSKAVIGREMEKALRAPAHGVFEFSTEDQPGRYIRKRMYYMSIANQKGKIHRIIGIAGNIEREHHHMESWKEKANTDQMTGFLNHEAAFLYMEEALRDAGGGALIVLDVDNFKRVNDTIGHIQGDECIKKIAELLKRAFRKEDLIGRIGGDEFLIFLSGPVQLTTAKERTEEFFADLSKVRMPRIGSIMCSAGIAGTDNRDVTIKELLSRADYALYEAKNAGKGHIVSLEKGKAVHYGQTSAEGQEEDAAKKSQEEYALLGMLYYILHHEPCKAVAINEALTCLGQAMDVSRVYVLEIEEDGIHITNTYEWCAKGISSQRQRLQHIDMKELDFDINECFEESNMWFCPDVALVTNPRLRRLLEEQHIFSLLNWAFWRDGKIAGMIGFDECRKGIVWSSQYVDALQNAGSLISQTLAEKDYIPVESEKKK